MALETGTYISDLVATNPTASDPKSQGDDHLRLVKSTVKATFPNITGAVTATHTQLNTVATKADIASPAFTGTPTAPTAASGTSTTQLATTAFVVNTAFSSALPAQTGNAGKYVTTNGTIASWAFPIPDQTSNSGKYLTTNGAIASWAFPIPDQTSNSGKYLTTNGTAASWAALASQGIQIANPSGGTLTNTAAYQAFVADATYTLPDFTGSSTFGLASLSNSPAVPSTVTTADGWTIAPGLTAGTFKAVAPLSSANAHGAWGSVTQTPPVVATFSAVSAPTLEGTVQLSSGLVVLLYSVSTGTGLYVVALNTTTNTFGTPVSLGTTTNPGVPLAIFADTATTFVVGYRNASNNGTLIAGSVSGTTITLGTAVAGTYGYGVCIQLASGLYVINSGNGQVEAFSVAGTICSKGNNAASGVGSNINIVKVSSTSFLAVGHSTIASPAQLQVAVCSVSGNTTTANTMVAAASTILRGSVSLRFLRALALGGPFVCCAQDDTTPTTGDYYGITVSGVTPTIGTVLQVANALPTISNPNTYQYPPAAASTSQNLFGYSATQLLVGVSSGAYALSISGTTLTVGAKFGASQPYFVNDALTGANVYAVQNSTIDKITVSGTTITSSYSVAGAPKVVASDTLNDKAVNYASTWYAWSLPAMSVCITPTKWLGINGSTVSLYGSIA